MSLEVGQLLDGKYRIERVIGAGGMGRVFEAKHEGLGTPVAVKCLLPHLARVPTLSDRFMREARVCARLSSQYVTRVTDVNQLADGTPYLVMELLTGELLQQRLERLGQLPQGEAVEIALQILSGLQEAHALGIVHRDLKPENVFLLAPREGEAAGHLSVKLLDFGIAKVKSSSEYQNWTKPGTAMGTPEYMAPEQAYSADQADERSDVYSVGVMLYEMLSGRLPAEGETPLEIANKIIAGVVTPLAVQKHDLPVALTELVTRAMSPKPEQRPESAQALAKALEPFRARATVEPARGSTRPGHASPAEAGKPQYPYPGSNPPNGSAGPVSAPSTTRGLGALGVGPSNPPPAWAPSKAPGPALVGASIAPGGGAAKPLPPTEQMSAVALDAVVRGRAASPAGRVAPTAPDTNGAKVESSPQRPKSAGGGGARTILATLGLLAIGAAGFYYYRETFGPGPAPAPPRLPAANTKR
jgi:eukaryotic-like serine/threonine-protein kinase